MNPADEIKQKALDLGFDLVGITDASPLSACQVEKLADWLKAGCAGRLDYMHRNFAKRIDPSGLLEGAKSLIIVGLNYTPPKKQKEPSNATAPIGKVASYALYEDYHRFIKSRLRKLTGFICSIAGASLKFRLCVDSAPLAERAFAARAGLGFIGKNHMLINPKLGCQIFLGEIITSLKLQSDGPITTGCSNCNKCVDACPTVALRADGQFDANRCIGYLTAEYKGQIPPELAQKIGSRLFGCDECTLACPYQQRAPVCKNRQFKFHSSRAELNLNEILNLNREEFQRKFADSVIKRSGLQYLKRNARICLANITRL